MGTRTARRLLTGLLAAYGTGVAAVTLLPIRVRPAAYWVGEPWWTVFHWKPFDVDAPSFVLNVIMFLPYGILVPLRRPALDRWRRLAGHAAAASFTIEAAQFVLGVTLGSRRTVDVNDLIANTAGALLGLLVLRLAVPRAAHRAFLDAPPGSLSDAPPATPG